LLVRDLVFGELLAIGRRGSVRLLGDLVDLLAEVGAALDLLAQQVGRGQVRVAELLGDVLALRAAARAGRARSTTQDQHTARGS
jgi:hypothetical protein